MTTAPTRKIIVSEYLYIIYPAFVAPWFPRSVYVLKCSVYFGILTWSRAWFTTNSRTTGATRCCCEDYQWRQVGKCADTSYKRIHIPVDSGAVAARQLPTRLQCESKTTDERTVLTAVFNLWCSYRQRRDTELTAMPAGCRAIQTVTNCAAPLALMHISLVPDSPPLTFWWSQRESLVHTVCACAKSPRKSGAIGYCRLTSVTQWCNFRWVCRQSIRQCDATHAYRHTLHASVKCPCNYLLIQHMHRQYVPGPIL